jgi:hypothetical protein
MPLSSGYSIQRNELTQVPHRVHQEHHVSDGQSVLVLKSMIDFQEKNWEWDIRVKSVRRYLDRNTGNNFLSGIVNTINEELNYWESDQVLDVYTEGDITDELQVVEFDQNIGVYGGLRWRTEYIPSLGDTITITFRENPRVWAGNGGLLHQLATDLCTHPYDVPELRVVTTSDYDESLNLFEVDLNELGYLDDVVADDVSGSDDSARGLSTQRKIKDIAGVGYGLWRVVRSDKYTFNATLTMASGVDKGLIKQSVGGDGLLSPLINDGSLTTSGIAPTARQVHVGSPVIDTADRIYIPYTKSDLGNGEFVLSVDGRVIPKEFWYGKSFSKKVGDLNALSAAYTEPLRYTEFYFVGDFALNIPWVTNTDSCVVTISFQWSYSTLRPYGALVGPLGFGPEQQRYNDDYSFKSTDGGNFFWNYYEPSISSRGKLELLNNEYFAYHDIVLLEYEKTFGLGFDPAFKLIYPDTTNDDRSVIEASCDQISNLFVVESTGAVDLLSMESQYGLSQHIPGGLKTQEWRIRFEWLYDTNELKVNVATKYQIKNDGSITKGEERDGVKQTVFRLPGELCDVYHEPVISRNVTTTSVKNKSHWFRRTQSKTLSDTQDTYPLSYRLTTTNHGVSLFVWEHSSVDSDTDSSWFVIQRHVDQTTGQPDIFGKTPLHCVYSPNKRVETFEGLQQYYASSDVSQLSPSPIIYDAVGKPLRNPSKTYWVSNDSVFDGSINSIDFFGKGYGSTMSSGASPQYPVVADLSVGVIPLTSITGYSSYWQNSSELPTQITSLNVQGFSDLPRNWSNNVWYDESLATPSDESPDFLPPHLKESCLSFSGNLIFTTLTPERMSPYGDISDGLGTCYDAADGSIVGLPSSDAPQNLNNKVGCIAEGRRILDSGWKPGMDYVWVDSAIPSASSGTDLNDWTSYADSLIDMLSPHNLNRKNEIKESMVISINDISVDVDINAYILSYDEWCKDGDPSTVPRFLESLDALGVDVLGPKFQLPMFSLTDTTLGSVAAGSDIFDADGVWDGGVTWADIVGTSSTLGVCHEQGLVFYFSSTGVSNTCKSGAEDFVGLDPLTLVSGGIISNSSFIQSTRNVNLYNKLPGDVVFMEKGKQNNYFYDFENKTLFFKKAPSRGVKLSISYDSFAEMGNYMIKTVDDRDFPSMEEDDYVNINRFVVRESDVLKPWDFHLSATKHSIDSYAIINPYEQLSITDDRNFVFSFPTQLTTQRFYYPTGELDMICISSAGFSSQGGHIEIDKYSDSTGMTTTVYTEGNNTFNPTELSTTPEGTGTDLIYSGQIDPSGNKYYWKRNIRKYEGMTSTLPNGNGMRVFVLVTGTSVRHSDVEKRTII